MLLILSAACSRTNLGKSKIAQQQKVDSLEAIVVVTDNVVPLTIDKKLDTEKIPWNKIANNAAKSDSIIKKLDFDIVNYDKINKFSTYEKTNVSSCSYDPFEGGDELYFDMQQLKNKFCYPVDGEFLSKYGWRSGRMHSGVDIRAELGQEVRAVMTGVVRMSKYYYGYGNVVVIRHPNGLETVYGHNSKNLVKSGDIVASGDTIALGGRTGRATCTHVHFEVRVNGKTIDPKYLIDTKNRTIQSENFRVYKKGSSVYASNKTREAIQSEKSANLASKSESTAKNSSVEAKYYTVKSGDTLSKIAKINRTSINGICRLNGISTKTILKIGRKLRVS